MAPNSNWRKKTVDEVVEDLPQDEQVIVKRLRSLILECLPAASEKMEGVPFYSHHRMICFIWPPSIYFGPNKPTLRRTSVTLGFQYGNRMSNVDGVLLKENRNQVYCMYFKSLSEIKDEQIRALLFEAELVDEEFRKKG